jgi:hypothetical protein
LDLQVAKGGIGLQHIVIRHDLPASTTERRRHEYREAQKKEILRDASLSRFEAPREGPVASKALALAGRSGGRV